MLKRVLLDTWNLCAFSELFDETSMHGVENELQLAECCLRLTMARTTTNARLRLGGHGCAPSESLGVLAPGGQLDQCHFPCGGPPAQEPSDAGHADALLTDSI